MKQKHQWALGGFALGVFLSAWVKSFLPHRGR
jgi:hypothetical protein